MTAAIGLGTGGRGAQLAFVLGSLHQSVVTELMVDVDNLIFLLVSVVQVSPGSSFAKELLHLLRHVNGNAGNRKLLRVAAEIDLHDTTGSRGKKLVAELVGIALWHGR